MSAPLRRRRLLALGATGAAALVGAPLAVSGEVEEPDDGRMRLLATAILIELEWVRRAVLKEEILAPSERRLLRTLRATEQDHHRTIASVLAGAEPPQAEDYGYRFRRNAFGSPRRIWTEGLAIHEMVIGTGIGCLPELVRPDLRRLVGQIIAVEGTHDAAVRRAGGWATPQRVLPASLTVEQATRLIYPYLAG